jgi:tetratricopeptide (TPR) repeat protein
MDIATVFGARVFQFDWAHDFATARNFALSKASGRWILILDADEVISDRDGARVLDTVRQTDERSLAFSFVTRNYTNDVGTEGWQANSGAYQNEQAGKGWYPSQKVRLFPNLNSIRFENTVHELVEPCLRRLGIPIETCPIPIHHYGTLDKLKGARKRAEYYFLGKEKITNGRKNSAALVEHAIQAQEMGEYHEALDQWNQVLAQCPDLPQAHFNLSYVYIQLARYDKGVEAARQALELDPALKEAALNFALCQIRIGDIKSAIQELERFLQNYPDHPMGFGLLAIASVIDNKADRGLELFEKLHRLGFNCSEYIFEQAHKLKSAGQDKAANRLLAAIAESRFDSERLRSMRADRVGCQVYSRH